MDLGIEDYSTDLLEKKGIHFRTGAGSAHHGFQHSFG